MVSHQTQSSLNAYKIISMQPSIVWRFTIYIAYHIKIGVKIIVRRYFYVCKMCKNGFDSVDSFSVV